MHLSSAPSLSQRKAAGVLILPFWKEGKEAKPACAMRDFASVFAFPVKNKDFHGKPSECLMLYHKGGRIMLLGLGSKKECTAETLRRAYGAAAKLCRHKKIGSINAAMPESGLSDASAAEGILLANYAFDQLKAHALKDDPTFLIEKICFVGTSAKALAECKKSAQIIEAVNFARDLINGNADDVTPQALSRAAKDLEKEYSKVKTTVFDKKRIEKEKLGLLLAVNRGSTRDPAFILIEYRGNPKKSDMTAIVGKGITYDTGGLNLKPTGSMETMKDDMSGAAAVLGTIKAAAALRLPVNILGVIASTENAIGPDSYKPGDVYKSYSGKTVEIANTDAEGRLVLADALAYAQDHFKPSRIIDLATLTGSIVIALGEETTGLFSNNDKLAKGLIKAGEETHERVWRMPLFPEYKEGLKSSIADMKNCGDRKGGSITAAKFLEEFIKKTPWAHLDIAGTAYLSNPKYYHPTNATGVGVRLLIQFLQNLE